MKPMVNITGISPNTLASLNGAEIPARITFSETTIHIQIDLPPPVNSFVKRLRHDFVKIESHFSGQSLEIMQCLLASPEGQASRNGLIDGIWEKVPTFGAIRQAIRRLNAVLTKLNVGYTVRGNRKGIYRLLQIEK